MMDEGSVQLEFTPGFGMSHYIGPPYTFSATARRREVPERVANHLMQSFPRNFKLAKPAETSDFSESELEDTTPSEPSKATTQEGTSLDDLMDESKTSLTTLRHMARERMQPGQRLPRDRAALAQFIFENEKLTPKPEPELESKPTSGKRGR